MKNALLRFASALRVTRLARGGTPEAVGTGNVFFRFDGRRPRRTGNFQIGKNPGTPARRDMSPPPALAEDERSNESLSVRIKEAGEPAVLSAPIQSALR